MSSKSLLGLVVVIALAACGGDDGGGSGNNAGGGAGTPAQPTSGTGGAAGTMVGTSGTGGGGAGTGGAAAMICMPDPGTTTCGGTACPMVAANLAALCTQTCCTADQKCGTRNANMFMPTQCGETVAEDPDCPDATILGMQIQGCCMPDGMSCGLIDATGFFGGGCRPRCSAAPLVPGIMDATCDGQMMSACPMPMGGAGGTGGAGGAAGMSSAGTGGMAGGGDSGTGGDSGSGGAGSGGAGTGGAGAGG